MAQATFEPLEQGEGFFGAIEGFEGLWASADTIESCRSELRSRLEDWIVLGLSMGHSMPAVSGIRLEVKKSA